MIQVSDARNLLVRAGGYYPEVLPIKLMGYVDYEEVCAANCMGRWSCAPASFPSLCFGRLRRVAIYFHHHTLAGETRAGGGTGREAELVLAAHGRQGAATRPAGCPGPQHRPLCGTWMCVVLTLQWGPAVKDERQRFSMTTERPNPFLSLIARNPTTTAQRADGHVVGEIRSHVQLRNLATEFGEPIVELVLAKKREIEMFCPSG